MTLLHETIEVDRPIEEVFSYISDFSTTREWDATAFAARKLTPGAVAAGTEFEVQCALPVGSITLIYTVEELVPQKYIRLRGTSKLFDVIDSIAFASTQQGTQVDYQAKFEFNPLVKPMASLSQAGLEKMGRDALAGMKEALEDDFEVVDRPGLTRRADRWIVPGLGLFTKWGYNLARKHFNPVSAYLEDKHMVITGASAGLGYAAAQMLAQRGAQLTLVMRNRQKAKDTVAALKEETGNPNISYEIADLALMKDVDALVRRLLKRGQPIDVLVNNAGALFNPRGETAEGLEQSFALLLLSPYRLTLGLKPLLEQAPGSRVVNVVSGGMYSQKLEVDSLIIEEGEKYSGSVAYARQKRALMVLTQEWARAWAKEGIVVNAMHPGWADTPGVQGALPEFRSLTRRVLRSSEEGADTIFWLAAATEAADASGELFLDRLVHSPYFTQRTKEEPGEREALLQFLADFKV
jgi:NAD(P)-dependent dehydrogenase (short-subunit alcohol dehydrogenase family)